VEVALRGGTPVTADGLILLGFIALAFAVLVVRARRRVGMPVTGRVLAAAIFGFAIVVLILWATRSRA
jgi:hypothetical protein